MSGNDQPSAAKPQVGDKWKNFRGDVGKVVAVGLQVRWEADNRDVEEGWLRTPFMAEFLKMYTKVSDAEARQ